MHHQGKPIGILPASLGAPARTIVMGGSRGYEVYLATLELAPGASRIPFHFEGWQHKFSWQWPTHTLDVGQAFVDGDTVLRRR